MVINRKSRGARERERLILTGDKYPVILWKLYGILYSLILSSSMNVLQTMFTFGITIVICSNK